MTQWICWHLAANKIPSAIHSSKLVFFPNIEILVSSRGRHISDILWRSKSWRDFISYQVGSWRSFWQTKILNYWFGFQFYAQFLFWRKSYWTSKFENGIVIWLLIVSQSSTIEFNLFAHPTPNQLSTRETRIRTWKFMPFSAVSGRSAMEQIFGISSLFCKLIHRK